MGFVIPPVLPLPGRHDADVGLHGRHQLRCGGGDFRKPGFQAGSVAVVHHDGDFHGLVLREASGSWAGHDDPGRSGAVELAMRASWGEVKWLDVRLVVVPWLPDVGTVVVYLFRERVTDAAQPLGDLVVVVEDDEADPPALTEVTDEPDVQPLTPRELEVLRLMALGWETEYIAAELEVALHTVRSHVANLRRKLNAKSRFEAVMTATRLGILSLGDR